MLQRRPHVLQRARARGFNVQDASPCLLRVSSGLKVGGGRGRGFAHHIPHTTYHIPHTTSHIPPPPHHLTTSPPYHLTTLPPCRPTTLPPYHPTALPPYHPTALPPYHPTTLPPHHPRPFLFTLPCVNPPTPPTRPTPPTPPPPVQVMGAGMTYNEMYDDEVALQWASITKLTRNLFLAAASKLSCSTPPPFSHLPWRRE